MHNWASVYIDNKVPSRIIVIRKFKICLTQSYQCKTILFSMFMDDYDVKGKLIYITQYMYFDYFFSALNPLCIAAVLVVSSSMDNNKVINTIVRKIVIFYCNQYN